MGIRDQTSPNFDFKKMTLHSLVLNQGGADGNMTIEFWDINFLTKKAKHSMQPISDGKEKFVISDTIIFQLGSENRGSEIKVESVSVFKN
jgi:hypothetical protein